MTVQTEGRRVVIKELNAVGLETNHSKSGVFTSSGICLSECADWWGTAIRHDSFVLCGKPFQQEEAGLDELLEARSTPTGTESFVSAFLDTHASKVAGLVEVLVSLVSLATLTLLHANPPPCSCVAVRQQRLQCTKTFPTLLHFGWSGALICCV